jgi:Protein  of unknown function (DUF3018)
VRQRRPSSTPSAKKVRNHRAKLRAQGLRPVQIWVRDTRAPGFAEEARRQSLAVAAADQRDEGLFAFMDAAWADLEPK